MDKPSSSFSPQAHQTTDGSATYQPSSDAKEGNSKKAAKKPVRLTNRQQNEVVRLYKSNAGTAREIAYTYDVHITTVYKLLRKKKVKVHSEAQSVGATQALLQRHQKLREIALARHAKKRDETIVEPTLQIAYEHVPQVEHDLPKEEPKQEEKPRKTRAKKPVKKIGLVRRLWSFLTKR